MKNKTQNQDENNVIPMDIQEQRDEIQMKKEKRKSRDLLSLNPEDATTNIIANALKQKNTEITPKKPNIFKPNSLKTGNH
jgi:hypothetical protein